MLCMLCVLTAIICNYDFLEGEEVRLIIFWAAGRKTRRLTKNDET